MTDQTTDLTPEQVAVRSAMPAGAPEGLEKAALGRDVSAEEEVGALDFLLGRTQRLQYTVHVDYDTPVGVLPLDVRIQQMDERRLNALDAAARSGDGPFAKLDTTAFNTAVCAEGIVWIEDSTGRRSVVDSEEFIGGAANMAIAMETRFKYQPGILGELCDRIREMSGYNPQRVGQAQRVLSNAVGKS